MNIVSRAQLSRHHEQTGQSPAEYPGMKTLNQVFFYLKPTFALSD